MSRLAPQGPGSRAHAPATLASALPVVHLLHPGDVRCATRGDRLDTLLGSCVAILLTDPRRTVGAMCHIVNAVKPPAPRGARTTRNTRFAEDALAAMFDALTALAIAPRLCEAHVVGGGNMFPGVVEQADVGAHNLARVAALLTLHGIAVRSQSTGGAVYRKVAWTIGDAEPAITCVNL